MRAYFSPTEGIGYSLCRTSIHSCDFSSAPNTYVAENHKALKTLSVRHDEEFRIPFIKQAIQMAGGHLTLYDLPWSSPGWIKN